MSLLRQRRRVRAMVYRLDEIGYMLQRWMDKRGVRRGNPKLEAVIDQLHFERERARWAMDARKVRT